MKMSQRAAVYAGAICLLLAAVAIPIWFDFGDKPFEPALAQVAESELPAAASPAAVDSVSTEPPLREAAPLPSAPAASGAGSGAVAAAPPLAAPSAEGFSMPDLTASSDPPASASTNPLPAASHAAAASVTAAVYNGGAGSQKAVYIPVLYYHSVQVMPGSTAVVSPTKFTEQMQYLADNGYHPLTMAEFSAIMEGQAAAPDKPVLLTFDDGYVDNHSTVMPLLSKLGFPATLFMSPGVMDDKRFINWEQAADLRDSGWDIHPHGMTHPYLTKLTAEEQAYEITEARKQIEEKLGVTADVFCYPYGQYNNTTLKILKDNGFRYAFTIDQGKTNPKQHPYKLKRVFVNGEEDLSALVRKLTKW